MRVLILMLAIAIGIQNTCPQGWAAKTAFVTCHTFHRHEGTQPLKDERSDRRQEGYLM